MFWSDIVLVGILLLSVILLVTMLTSLALFIPAVPTPRKVVRYMVNVAGLKGTETVYDLGCGDARILIECKRRFPGIRAVGYELALGVWMLARLRAWLARKEIAIRMRNFMNADLKDADVIFLYLVPEVMPKLAQKLGKELRPGTKVISHGFEFPGKEPLKVERCPLPSWHFFRPSGKVGPRVFVYRW